MKGFRAPSFIFISEDLAFPMKKIDMFKEYVIRLCFRCSILLIGLAAYFMVPDYFDLIVTKSLENQWELQGLSAAQVVANLSENYNIIWIYLVWGILMMSMVLQMIPDNKRITMGSRKEHEEFYAPVEGYSELEMYRYVQKQNVAAIWVLIVWLSFNAVFGALYVTGIIHTKELIMLTLFYYVADLICVVIWCPFQSFFMKNRCCVNCRIFNWGHFMMFTPMLFIRHFLSWSLFFTSLIVMLRWEITLLRHPERFWEGSNKVLRCENCKDKICRLKGPKFIQKH